MLSIGAWQFSTFVGISLLAFSLLYSWQAELPYKLLVGYLLAVCLWGGFFDPEGPHTSIQLALQWKSLQVLVMGGAFLSFFKLASDKTQGFFKDALLGVLVLDSLWLLTGGDGIFVGKTLDTLVMAIFLPLFSGRWRIWALPLVAAIFYQVGLASYIVLFIHAFIWAWHTRRRLAFFITGGLMALMVFIPRFTVGERLMPRVKEAWSPAFAHWVHNGDFFFGFGPWSYQWLSVSEKIGSRPMIWMHNDWLQILFEFGSLGFALFATAYAYTVVRLRYDPVPFAITVALGFGMMAYSPLQFFIVQYLMFYVVLRSTNKLTKVDVYPKVGLETIPSEEC